MEGKQRLEITDLLEEAVENAIARRNQALYSEENLSNLSNEEAVNIVGGLSFKPPIVTQGIIATDPTLELA